MIAPFPSTWEEIQRRHLVNEILDECWKNPNAGYEIQPTDEWIVNNQQHQQLDGNAFDILEQENLDDDDIDIDKMIATLEKPSTYGEITPLGARQLFGAMELLDDSTRKHEHQLSPGHFFDLGSGTGKLVGQAILELPNKRVEKATGIELSPSRHECAIRAKEALLRWPRSNIDRPNFTLRASNDGSNEKDGNYFLSKDNSVRSTNKLELLQGDLFDVDLSTATHIYVASLCFPHNLMLRLEERLQMLIHQPELQEGHCRRDETEERELRQEESSLQWVATLQPFPNHLGGIRPAIRFMEMSWTKPFGCAVYLYRCNGNSRGSKDGKIQ